MIASFNIALVRFKMLGNAIIFTFQRRLHVMMTCENRCFVQQKKSSKHNPYEWNAKQIWSNSLNTVDDRIIGIENERVWWGILFKLLYFQSKEQNVISFKRTSLMYEINERRSALLSANHTMYLTQRNKVIFTAIHFIFFVRAMLYPVTFLISMETDLVHLRPCTAELSKLTSS